MNYIVYTNISKIHWDIREGHPKKFFNGQSRRLGSIPATTATSRARKREQRRDKTAHKEQRQTKWTLTALNHDK